SYENHIKAARSDVRKFENHVLPLIEDKLTDLSVQRLDLDKIRELRDAVYAELGDEVSAEKPLFTQQLQTELDKTKRNSRIIAGVGQYMINKSEGKLHAANAQLDQVAKDRDSFKALAKAYKRSTESKKLHAASERLDQVAEDRDNYKELAMAYRRSANSKDALIAKLQAQLAMAKR
ncbi:MAG TPA: hypothetical protein VF427_10635, partial [Noviherbaspirillum sp.]